MLDGAFKCDANSLKTNPSSENMLKSGINIIGKEKGGRPEVSCDLCVRISVSNLQDHCNLSHIYMLIK
jgi:hypothetical protein